MNPIYLLFITLLSYPRFPDAYSWGPKNRSQQLYDWFPYGLLTDIRPLARNVIRSGP